MIGLSVTKLFLPMKFFSICKYQFAINLLSFLVFSISGGIISFFAGMDIGPDLINYHLYSGEFLINGRGADDVVAAGLQTFFNPLYYGFYYFLFSSLPAVLAGIVLGALHGLIGYATFLLTLTTLQKNELSDIILSFITGGLALFSPFVIATIGGSFSDVTQSILVILSIAIFFYSGWDTPDWTKNNLILLILCGLICGFAVGIKLSHFFMATSLGFAIVLFMPFVGLKATIRNTVLVGIGGISGILITNIWWSFVLFQDSGSLFYPYTTSNSSMVAAYETPGATNFPAQAAAQSFAELIRGPLNWSIGIPPRTEWYFKDTRMLITLPIIIIFISLKLTSSTIHFFLRNRAPEKGSSGSKMNKNLGFLIIFFVLAYLQWVFTVGSIRYAIGLFALASLIAFICVYTITIYKYYSLIFISVASVYISYTMVPTWFGRMEWETSWADKLRSQSQIGPPAVYLTDANSFWLPFFNDEAKFLRIADLRPGDTMFDKAKRVWGDVSLPNRVILGLPYGGQIAGRQMINQWLIEAQKKIDISTCQIIDIDYADYQAIHCDVVKINQKIPNLDYTLNLEDRLQFPVLAKNNIDGKRMFNEVGSFKIFDSIFSGQTLVAHVEPNYYSDVPFLVEIGHGPSRSFKWVGNPGSYMNIYNIQDAPEDLLEFKINRQCIKNGFPNSQNDHYQLNLYSLALRSGIGAVPNKINLYTNGKRFFDFASAVQLPEYLIHEPLQSFEGAGLDALIPSKFNSPVVPIDFEGKHYIITQKDRNGLLQINDVPAGSYLIRLWAAAVQPGSPAVNFKIYDKQLAFRTSRCFTPVNIPVFQNHDGPLEISISDEQNSSDVAISKLDLIKIDPLDQDVNFSLEHSALSQFFTYVNFPATEMEHRLVSFSKSELTLPVLGNDKHLLRLQGVNPNDKKDILFDIRIGEKKFKIWIKSHNFEIYIPLIDVPLQDRMKISMNIKSDGDGEVDTSQHVVISEIGLITDPAKRCAGSVNLDVQKHTITCVK